MQILVVDNSPDANARDTVLSIEGGRRSITYLHEIHRGIPVARNSALQALQHLQPTWVAFIDDDEMAPQGWLARMLLIGSAHKADVVHGSVRTVAATEIEPAARTWNGTTPFRPGNKTTKAATNNVLLRSWLVLPPVALRFDTNMVTGGSDGESFMRAADCGAHMVHTKDAPVFEELHPERETPSWKRQRAFRVGANCNYRYRKNSQTRFSGCRPARGESR